MKTETRAHVDQAVAEKFGLLNQLHKLLEELQEASEDAHELIYNLESGAKIEDQDFSRLADEMGDVANVEGSIAHIVSGYEQLKADAMLDKQVRTMKRINEDYYKLEPKLKAV